MHKGFYFSLLGLLLVFGCSTEKKGFANRSYHYMTARYNGYFHAQELVNEAMFVYGTTYQEDFTEILPIENFPNETEARKMYASLDTAKSKCYKVIAKHSMPNPTKSKKPKAEELNKFIDENWLLIAKANFIKREYDEAYENFDFIDKFFKENKTAYEALLWKAKIHIKNKDYAKATLIFSKLDRRIEKDESKEKKKKVRKKRSKYSKKKKKVAEPDKFPKKLKDDLEMVRAELAYQKGDYPKAVEYLEKALEFTKGKEQKARLSFILGQLYSKTGDSESAVKHFTTALRKSPDYEMEFYARINRAMVANGAGSEKLVKELKKMLKDEKNAEFKDQIYFALANIELNNGNKDLCVWNLHKSVALSLKNPRQKGKSYLQLADMHFADKDYLKAQKYYDSCAQAIPEGFPNGEEIKNKAEKLEDLVFNIETVALQDSLQRIAKLSPEEQEKFVDKLSKDLEKAEEERLQAEAIRLKELQELKAQFDEASSGSGDKWYFYNAKLKNNGSTEFQQLWGNRKLEDNWRRKNKVNFNSFEETESGDSLESQVDVEEEDPFDPDLLLANVPNTQGAIDSSNVKLMKSLYESGVIYKEQLGEKKLAIKQFESVINREVEDVHVLPSAYQLYTIYADTDASKSSYYKDFILNNYPNSEFANIIRDPEFIKKKMERREEVQKEYAAIVDRYENNQYGLVVAKCNKVIQSDSLNEFLPKYYLLKAYALGKSPYGDDKVNLVASLNELIERFPISEEADHAKLILKKLKSSAVSAESSLYKEGNSEKHYFIVVLPEYAEVSKEQNNLHDFNQAYFGSSKLNVQPTMFEKDSQLFIVREFANAKAAMDYYKTIDEVGGKAKELQNFERFVISVSNFGPFFGKKDVAGYKKFFQNTYQ